MQPRTPVVNDMRVDLVRNQKQVVLVRDRRNFFEHLARVDRARRIVRRKQ